MLLMNVNFKINIKNLVSETIPTRFIFLSLMGIILPILFLILFMFIY